MLLFNCRHSVMNYRPYYSVSHCRSLALVTGISHDAGDCSTFGTGKLLLVLVVHYLTTFCQSQASKNAGYMTYVCLRTLAGTDFIFCVLLYLMIHNKTKIHDVSLFR